MDDLRSLNARIITQMGAANVNLRTTLDILTVCLGKLKPSARELQEALGKQPGLHENSLDVTSINKEYLHFARQTSRDIVRGAFEGLIILNVDLAQAKILATLSNQQITDLSRRWPGTIFQGASAVKQFVGQFHAAAVPHYSAALLAAA